MANKKTNQLKAWTGKFGKNYTDRNSLNIKELNNLYKKNWGITREDLNKQFIGKLNKSIKILEVGCNIGLQLNILKKLGFKNLYGLEPQVYALKIAEKRNKNICFKKGNIFNIPYKDNFFDLVFTSGVLIHIHPNEIRKSLKEVYRCSKKYIWGFEYYSKNYESIDYRNKKDLLWKADFLKIYTKTFPDLRIIKTKHLKYLNNDKIDVMFLLEKKL